MTMVGTAIDEEACYLAESYQLAEGQCLGTFSAAWSAMSVSVSEGSLIRPFVGVLLGLLGQLFACTLFCFLDASGCDVDTR